MDKPSFKNVKDMLLCGILSSENVDSSGEIVSLKGMDISSLEAGEGVAGPKAWKEAGGQNPADFAGAAVKSMTQMSQMIVSFDEGVTVFKDAVNLFAGKVGYVPPVHAKGPGVVKLPPSSRQM